MPTDNIDIMNKVFEVPVMKSPSHGVLFQIREAASAPSSLAHFLADPATTERLRQKAESNNGLKGSRRALSITKMALVEEERQISRLKALLAGAADHLEHEMRRADEGELRAYYAELHERETNARLVAAEAGNTQAEAEQLHALAECQKYQIELQGVEMELQRAKADLRRAERLKDEFEEARVQVEEMNGRLQKQLMKYRIREERMIEGHKVEVVNSFDEGWEEGNKEGFEAGRKIGYEAGRNEERKKIDRVLGHERETTGARVHKWVIETSETY